MKKKSIFSIILILFGLIILVKKANINQVIKLSSSISKPSEHNSVATFHDANNENYNNNSLKKDTKKTNQNTCKDKNILHHLEQKQTTFLKASKNESVKMSITGGISITLKK